MAERLTLNDARVTAGVVEVLQDGAWLPASDVVPLSDAIADSTGKALIGENFAVYVVNTQPDVATLIDLVNQLAESVKLMTTLTVSRTPDQAPFDPAGTPIVEQIIADLGAIELT